MNRLPYPSPVGSVNITKNNIPILLTRLDNHRSSALEDGNKMHNRPLKLTKSILSKVIDITGTRNDFIIKNTEYLDRSERSISCSSPGNMIIIDEPMVEDGKSILMLNTDLSGLFNNEMPPLPIRCLTTTSTDFSFRRPGQYLNTVDVISVYEVSAFGLLDAYYRYRDNYDSLNMFISKEIDLPLSESFYEASLFNRIVSILGGSKRNEYFSPGYRSAYLELGKVLDTSVRTSNKIPRLTLGKRASIASTLSGFKVEQPDYDPSMLSRLIIYITLSNQVASFYSTASTRLKKDNNNWLRAYLLQVKLIRGSALYNKLPTELTNILDNDLKRVMK